MGIRGYKKFVTPTPEIHELKQLIDKWREPSLEFISSRLVVPDTSNRGHTGLSVDHCHLIASIIQVDGFRSREPDFVRKGQQGHDIPVLVRGSPDSPISSESLSYWKEATAGEPLFPRVKIGETGEWFTSLGNGHFMQALNLLDQRMANVFTEEKFIPNPADAALGRALSQGVQSIVLRPDIPVADRRRLAILLNSTHDYKWGVDASGAVDVRPEACANARYTLFEAETKFIDAGLLSLRVRLELGLKTSDRSEIQAGRDGTPWPTNKQLDHLQLNNPRSKL